jgi:hypothetical protein
LARGEANMKKLGNAPFHWRLRREGIGVGLVASLALAGVALGDAPAVPGDNPAVAVSSGSTVAPAPAPKAAPVLADDPATTVTTPSAEQQQRRVLMLLLMNSAGPIGPYGSLGR